MKLNDVISELQSLADEGYGDYHIEFVCDTNQTYFNDSENTYSTDSRIFDFDDPSRHREVYDQQKIIQLHSKW